MCICIAEKRPGDATCCVLGADLTMHSGMKLGLILPACSSPCRGDLRRTFASIYSQAAIHSGGNRRVSPQPVQDVLTQDPLELLQCAQSCHAVPLRIQQSIQTGESRANELLCRLRGAENRIIDVELGRYDDIIAGSFEQISMRLGQYLDWLESAESSGGKVSGRQLYLAQWRASDDVRPFHFLMRSSVQNSDILNAQIPDLASVVRPPSLLAALLKSDDTSVDLYQSSFFIGPAGAVRCLPSSFRALFVDRIRSGYPSPLRPLFQLVPSFRLFRTNPLCKTRLPPSPQCERIRNAGPRAPRATEHVLDRPLAQPFTGCGQLRCHPGT